MNIQLSEQWQEFIREEVRGGRFPTESAVLEGALALLKQREQQQSQLGLEAGSETKSIGEIIDKIMSDVPEDVLDRLPVDGAAQHDHYIYGRPKRLS